jgi:hypothetical protein
VRHLAAISYRFVSVVLAWWFSWRICAFTMPYHAGFGCAVLPTCGCAVQRSLSSVCDQAEAMPWPEYDYLGKMGGGGGGEGGGRLHASQGVQPYMILLWCPAGLASLAVSWCCCGGSPTANRSANWVWWHCPIGSQRVFWGGRCT